MSFVVGIDIGGTFTDGFAVELETSTSVTAKTPTTVPDPLPAVFTALSDLAHGLGKSRAELLQGCVKFVHGTTLTTNVLLERRGATVGLVATQGFGDAILMMSGKGRVAGLSLMERRHFRATDKPEPIVPRERIIEVAERVDLDGDVVIPLPEEAIGEVAERVAELGFEACAISLLWSFRNPDHERKIACFLRERFPDLYVSVSSEIAPLLGEYERTATSVVNAYVGPAVIGYLATVEDALRGQGLRSSMLVVQSSGGVAEVSQTEPVNTIESGPAVGVRGSVGLLEQIGERHAIVTDVGGTTFKVSIVRERNPGLTTETVLGQYTLLVPMIDVVSIGAGGGSIAWLDGDRLRVGPRSAGSSPGPACYGWGGTQPTVTDADLVLGYLNSDYFLGGRMDVSVDAAYQAIAKDIADPLFAGDVVAAAAGIREIIDTQMADLILKASLERGHDPRDFVIIAYGGAGPVHCGAYAAELGCLRIVVPQNATVYSAEGAALSDLQHSFQIARQLAAPGDAQRISEDFVALERKARDTLRAEGIRDDEMLFAPWADMRYRRQFHELRIPLGTAVAAIDSKSLGDLSHRFEEDYARRYGEGAGHGSHRIEYVRFGLEAIGQTPKPIVDPANMDGSRPEEALKGTRQVFWREGRALVATPIYDGTLLPAGSVLEGPAVIEHPGTSVVVHPGQRAQVDPYLNTLIELEEPSYVDRRRPRHL